MAVWKIGSRWSHNGNPDSSILDIFIEHQMVFVYNITQDDKNKCNIESKIQENDFIALSDGELIVAIGKVLKKPFPITENWPFGDESRMADFRDENVIAIKIKLLDLKEEDKFCYKHWGRFHALHGDVEQKILTLWQDNFDLKKQNKTFSIKAKTYTLKFNAQNENEIVLNPTIKYLIPVYQRPYSWTEEQLKKFISDIFLSYWGTERELIEEPMFIGTMQLSDKKYVDGKIYHQDVIDGQQRLSTFMVLFKVLKDLFPDSEGMEYCLGDWLETKVNNGAQNKFLTDFLSCDTKNHERDDESQNPYLKNYFIIKDLLEEHICTDQNNNADFDIKSFLEYVLSKIYFVVIETTASLSKNLQIFKAINTTGLDLNGGDVFKIRIYEYLCDKKPDMEDHFDKISALYEKIDQQNSELQHNITNSQELPNRMTNIHEILKIYQYFLIAKYELPNVLYNFATDTFFERLFDSIFKINLWEHFKNLKELELDLGVLNDLIDVRYWWGELVENYSTIQDGGAINLFLWYSRYDKHWVLMVLFLYRFKNDKRCTENFYSFMRQLSKLYCLYSILYLKAIGEIHSFTYNLTKSILDDSFDDIIEKINGIINTQNSLNNNRNSLEDRLSGDITHNARTKNIICLISAILEELNINDSENQKATINKLFVDKFDVEHIQSYNAKENREKIWEEWQENINSIGNLVILESKINKEIHNNPYEEKIKKYQDSRYKIVRDQAQKYKQWNLEKCLERKQSEMDKIIRYFFEGIELQ